MTHPLISMTRVTVQSLGLRNLELGDSETRPVPRKMALTARSALEGCYAQDIMCRTDEEMGLVLRVR